MSRILLFLFLIMPIFELALLITVGKTIGVIPTLSLLLFTAFAGVGLWRYQGFVTLRKVQERLALGELPDLELLEGALLMIAGLLLLIPGFFSDVLAFVCLVPVTRRFICRAILTRQFLTPYVRPRQQGDAADFYQSSNISRGPYTIEGEYRRADQE